MASKEKQGNGKEERQVQVGQDSELTQTTVGWGDPLEKRRIKMEMNNGIATVVLDNPDRMNIFDSSVLQEFDEIIDDIVKNEGTKVVLLTSNSLKGFTAGADITEMASHDPEEAKRFSELGHRIARRLERDVPPVVVALKGFVLGGGLEFACACDLRVASEDCIFSQPEIDIGVIPGWGGTQRLAKVVGIAKAREMIYTGARVDAYQALEIGLVNHVVPREELDSVAQAYAKGLSSKSRRALMAAKRSIRMSLEMDYEDGLDYETKEWASLFGTHDQKEGMKAFLEKRKPKFED
ncbi:MAG: enoyl-CoA hydratase/isomerase family protein [Methanobacteriota archaeon]|nr:MAG: enoyl-CoA hydratase/isomerase family protein [Euryarchaeota archaeon]